MKHIVLRIWDSRASQKGRKMILHVDCIRAVHDCGNDYGGPNYIAVDYLDKDGKEQREWFCGTIKKIYKKLEEAEGFHQDKLD